jgi:hypothetical protein
MERSSDPDDLRKGKGEDARYYRAGNNWEQFGREIDRFLFLGNAWGGPYLFRGQADVAWDNLLPSLSRLMEGLPVAKVMEAEKEAIKLFRKQAHSQVNINLFDSWDDPLDWWTRMQHYRAPTRLLDWTASPYVAAYFAVAEGWKTDGVVWFFHPSALATWMEKRHPIGVLSSADGRLCLPREQLFDPAAPPRLMSFHPIYCDDRMFAQQGHFTVCLQPLVDHATILEETQWNNFGVIFGKFVIPSRLKPEFLWRLGAMNIRANSLFPGMEGIGQSIAERLRLETVERPRDVYDLISINGRNDRLDVVAVIAQDNLVESPSQCELRLRDHLEDSADATGLSGWMNDVPSPGLDKDDSQWAGRTAPGDPTEPTSPPRMGSSQGGRSRKTRTSKEKGTEKNQRGRRKSK